MPDSDKQHNPGTAAPKSGASIAPVPVVVKPKQESFMLNTNKLPSIMISRLEAQVREKRERMKEGDLVGKYKIIDLIDSDTGTNDLYVVRHEETQDVHCLKVEYRSTKFPILKTELFILLEIRKKADPKHFCMVYDKGQGEKFNWIVMSLVGPSLKTLRREHPTRKLSLGCGLSVGKQCLKALEELHRIGFIHRDVSPSNFCIGRRELEEERKIYFVDFGYSHSYRDANGELKRPRPRPTRYMGCLRHAPRAAFLGIELSRMDDMESWFYMFVELLKGGLPWMNMRNPSDVYLHQRKCRTGLEKMHLLGGLPKQFEKIMNLNDRLTYYDEPDYNAICELIDEAAKDYAVEEFPYDWEEAAAKEGQSEQGVATPIEKK